MENKIMMPASYNVLSCEEMTYTEGGATFTEALLNWIPPIGWYMGVTVWVTATSATGVGFLVNAAIVLL